MEILYQDNDLVVISKPAGVVVNRAGSVNEPTVQDWFEEQFLATSQLQPAAEWQQLVPTDFDPEFGSPEEIFEERQGMVHRLDKDTSGVMIWARNPGSLVNLLAQFRQRQVQKQYLCLVHGKFSILEDTVSMPIGRSQRDRQKFAVDVTGRPAETHYRVEEYYSQLADKAVPAKKSKIYQGFSLVRCWPKTGRTHQIRVHMAALKHPLVGDIRYVGRKRAAVDPLWCPRQFLHAAEMTLHHPRTGEELHFVAPLAADLQQILDEKVVR